MNPYQMPQMRNTVNNNGIIWAQGIEGAKAFQMLPNSNAVLLDSENDGIFYIKTSDNVGMCTMRTFKFEEITNTPSKVDAVNLSEYVRKDELAELIKQFSSSEVTSNEKQTISGNANSENHAKPLITQ